MGASEALKVLSDLGMNTTQEFIELLHNFQNHAENLRILQSENDGRWHNILDDPDSVVETSSTAMILVAYLKGLSEGTASVLCEIMQSSYLKG